MAAAKNGYKFSVSGRKRVHPNIKSKANAETPTVGPKHIVPVSRVEKAQVRSILPTLLDVYLFFVVF